MATVRKFEELEIWQSGRKPHQKIYPVRFKERIAKDVGLKNRICGACTSADGSDQGRHTEFTVSLTGSPGRGRRTKVTVIPYLCAGRFSRAQFDEC